MDLKKTFGEEQEGQGLKSPSSYSETLPASCVIARETFKEEN